VAPAIDRPPLVVAPFDAELFGHWWYEGPEFLDFFIRRACEQHELRFITPESYLQRHPVNQVATPAGSSWGEEGHCRVWLNEKNQWIYSHLAVAQERMSELAARLGTLDTLEQRALRQAGRELLLAQASDWPFMIRTGTNPEYATARVKNHVLRFTALFEQISAGEIKEEQLRAMESSDNIFPDLNCEYWA
jgi:1,4-alpha-glucan branching enzyme